MASWMLHLYVFENISKKLDNNLINQGYYLIGNIIPDLWKGTGLTRENTHNQVKMHAPINYQVLISQLNNRSNKEEFSLLLGYICHLVLDNIWLEIIELPVIEKYIGKKDISDYMSIKKEEMSNIDIYFSKQLDIKYIQQIINGIQIKEIEWNWIKTDKLEETKKVIKDLLSKRYSDEISFKIVSENMLNNYVKNSIDEIRKIIRIR